MRPVDRGDAPTDAQGKAVKFADYKAARDPLISRIGDYCSYCEVALHSGVHVEHIRPKSHHKKLAKEWSNLLLACDYCNPTKGHKKVVLAEYYWPDQDNTARAFVYALDQAPSRADGLTPQQQAIVQSTLELTGLDRVPGHAKLSPRDRRWFKRREAWGIALACRQNLENADSPNLRNLIVFTAISRGFWSVWMHVFHDDTDMRSRLLASFPGTASDCFDCGGRPVPRQGGQL